MKRAVAGASIAAVDCSVRCWHWIENPWPTIPLERTHPSARWTPVRCIASMSGGLPAENWSGVDPAMSITRDGGVLHLTCTSLLVERQVETAIATSFMSNFAIHLSSSICMCWSSGHRTAGQNEFTDAGRRLPLTLQCRHRGDGVICYRSLLLMAHLPLNASYRTRGCIAARLFAATHVRASRQTRAGIHHGRWLPPVNTALLAIVCRGAPVKGGTLCAQSHEIVRDD